MAPIRAVVVDPEAPERLALREVEPPTPSRGEALVRVAAISLNRGEVRRVAAAAAGWRPGWDTAGTVEHAANDGSGPREGARVVGLLPEAAWAEVVAVPTDNLAVLPDGVSFAQAAALPVAGLTALYVLDRGGGWDEGGTAVLAVESARWEAAGRPHGASSSPVTMRF